MVLVLAFNLGLLPNVSSKEGDYFDRDLDLFGDVELGFGVIHR
jgi:hypothetical protein